MYYIFSEGSNFKLQYYFQFWSLKFETTTLFSFFKLQISNYNTNFTFEPSNFKLQYYFQIQIWRFDLIRNATKRQDISTSRRPKWVRAQFWHRWKAGDLSFPMVPISRSNSFWLVRVQCVREGTITLWANGYLCNASECRSEPQSRLNNALVTIKLMHVCFEPVWIKKGLRRSHRPDLYLEPKWLRYLMRTN